MAQTNFTPISLYYSTTAAAVPTAGNLVAGELAINTNDGKLFYKDSSGVVQTIASKAGNSGSFTNLAYTGTLTGGTGVVNLGSGQFYKDASGNVGIGTSSPTIKLVTIGEMGTQFSTNDSILKFGNNGTVASISATYGTTGSYVPIQFLTSDTERMRIDSSGYVGIGTSSASTYAAFVVRKAITGQGVTNASAQFSDAVNSAFWIGHTSGCANLVTEASNITFGFTNGSATSEKMRVTTNGDFLLGTTSTVGKITMVYAGTYGQYIEGPVGASTLEIFFSGSTNVGSISTTGTITAFNVSSDRRLKENIVSYTSGLQAISSITPRQYNYISDKETIYQGFIADELQQVIPHAVTGETNAVDENGNPIYQGVDASFLVPHLVSAIKELNARIIALENK
jgi:hypothetical protein